MLRFDPDTVTALIRDVVDTEVLPRFRHLRAEDIHAKSGPQDLVTEADWRAEAVLTERLRALLPGSKVVGEEAVHARPEILAALGTDGPVWIIDPVDGTANFAQGDPVFACIVALAVKGRTVMGWIDHCVERRTVVAVEGQGVVCEGQALRLPCPRGASLSALVGVVGGRTIQTILKPRLARVVRIGSAAHAYLNLLSGAADLAAFTRLKVWDHAAGILIYREAGGVARLVSGLPYQPCLEEGIPLMASSEEIWHEVASLLHDVAPVV